MGWGYVAVRGGPPPMRIRAGLSFVTIVLALLFVGPSFSAGTAAGSSASSPATQLRPDLGRNLPGLAASDVAPTPGPASAGIPAIFGNWTHPNGNPPPTTSPGMAYDAADGYVVLYGGTSSGSSYPFQSWTTWEFANGTWRAFDLSPSPPLPTPGSSMVYDGHDGYVLWFAGGSLNETWKFSHGAWTQLFPRFSPSSNLVSDMVYDPAAGAVVFYNGPRTWEFAAGQWKDVTNYTKYNGPPGLRYGSSALAYDTHDRCVLLGNSWDYSGEGWNSTWIFSNGNWTNITSTMGTPPPPRGGAVFLDDPALGGVILFGGGNRSPVYFNDSWLFANGHWSRLLIPHAPPANGGATVNDGAVYDVPKRTLLLDLSWPFRQLWSLGASNWTELSVYSRVAPLARSNAALGGTLLFGGRSASGAVLGDTWEFENGFWFNLTANLTVAPPARYDASMEVMGVNSGAVLLFGGTNGSHVFSDTWLFGSGGWRHLTTLPISPPARYGAALTFIPPRTAFLFGGTDGSTLFNDSWNYTAAHGWILAPTIGAPPARWAAGLVWHQPPSSISEVVLFGGQNRTTSFRDTWLLVGNRWSQVAKPNPGLLPPVGFAAAGANGLLYPRRLEIPFVSFGGLSGSTISNQTFLYRNGNWSRVTVGVGPSARYDASAAYGYWDSGNVLLFGGMGPTGPLSDTWEYYLP
jgi:hypothetical protein